MKNKNNIKLDKIRFNYGLQKLNNKKKKKKFLIMAVAMDCFWMKL